MTVAPTAVEATSEPPVRTAPPEQAREPPVTDPLERRTPTAPRTPPGESPPAGRRAPATGGPVLPTSVDDAISFAVQLGAEAIELRLEGEGVRITRQAFDVDLSRRGLSLPGLRFTRLRLTRGADGLPNGGQLSGEISAPFVRGTATLAVDAAGNLSGGGEGTFDIQALGRPHVTFSYVDRQWSGGVTVQGGDLHLPIPNVVVDEGRLSVSFTGDQLRGNLTATFHHAALGTGNVDLTMTNTGVQGGGGFTLTMPLLAGSHGDLSFADNELSASLALTAANVRVPIPGLSLDQLTGNIALQRGQVSGGLGFTATYAGLATLTLAQATFSNRGFTGARGTIAVIAPPLQGSSGSFVLDAQGRPSGAVTIQSDRIPIPILRRGSVTVRLREDGGVDVSGTGRIELGPVGGGDLSVSWVDGVLHIGADVNFRIRPLDPITGRLDYENGQIQGEIQTGITVGPLSGTVLLRYRDALFSGEGTLAYALGRFNGQVHIVVDPEGQISGDGTATFRLADWLTGTIGLVVHPDLNVDAHGELVFPNEVELFPAWRFERNFFHFEQDFPLWGITIPVVGSIGLIASVHANAGFRAAFGPGTLRNIRATGDISTRPDVEPAFTISGDFNVPAGAEIVLLVGGGIALAALVARIEGGIDLSGIAGLYGAITLTPTFAYRNGQYVLSGSALLAAAAQLRAGINAYARVVVGIGWLSGEVWRKDWQLAEWRFDTGWHVGLRAGIDYVLGEPFNPDVQFEPVDVDPQSIIRGAIPNSGDPVPAPPQPPAPQAQFQPTAGEAGTVAAAAAPPGSPPAAGGAPPAPGSAPPAAGTAPPGGGPAPAPGESAAPGAPGAPPTGASQPVVDPPAAETEPADDRSVDETYLVYVYDSLQQFFQRKEAATAAPEDELARRARERMRRGEPALPELPLEQAPETGPEEAPPRPRDERSRGRPLTPGVRSQMEEVFDTDLSHVRVHSDDAAREGARRLGAEAYTVGSHVYFGPSREPGTADAELLAHELTHVLQQEAGSGVAPRGSDAEQEAEHAARAVKRGEKPKPVRKRRSGEVHRIGAATPSAPPAAGASAAGAGPQGGQGPHEPFTEPRLRQILQTPGDPQLAAAIQQLKTREQLWAQAKQKSWDSQSKQFKDRNFVRMRFPGPSSLPRKSVLGTTQLEVGDYLLRHGEERTDDKERNQSKLSRLMYGQAPLPAGALEFSRSPQGTRAALTFEDVLGRYQAWQQATYGALGTNTRPSDNVRTLDSTQAEQNLQLDETGARLLTMRYVDGVEQGPIFNFSGGRWNRIAPEPPTAAPAGAAPLAPGAAAGAGPGTTTAATQAIMVADYQAHHVIPLWLASQSGKVSGDELTNLAPWHRNAHQTNHGFHHGVPTEIRESTTATDYRDFPAGTRFIISALEGGNATHPAPVPAVALTADEQWIDSPGGAAWMG